MTTPNHPLTEAFFEDTAPLVDELAQALLSLEQAWSAGPLPLEPLRSARALLHTIKGNAGMVGQSVVVEITHLLEEALLSAEAPGVARVALVDLLLAGTDLICTAMSTRGAADLNKATNALRLQASAFALHSAGAPETPIPAAHDQTDGGSAEKKPRLRVDLSLLDQLLDGLGEAISLHAMLQRANEQVDTSTGAADDEQLHRLGKSLRFLRELLVRARLVPLSTMFERFQRPMRDLARERGIAIEFASEGGELSVDRAICEQLAAPILHLLRNAVAHGIEPQHERERSGKPAKGSVSIAARADGDRTLITVSDDGRGLNVERLRERARALGVDTSGMDDEQSLRLALLPRVSTTEHADDLSGRGIGLDVAFEVLKNLGGSLSIHSQPGRGAAFVLELPSTLSLLQGLVVAVGNERYLLPMSSVVQTFRLTPEMHHEVNGQRAVRWKQLVPFVDLGSMLGVDESARRYGQRESYAALVHTGDNVRALGVDAVLGTVETVIKPLESGLSSLSYLTGAAVLADGSVALIVNPRALSERRAHESPMRSAHGRA